MSRRVLVRIDAAGEVHGFALDGGESGDAQVVVADLDGEVRVFGPGLSLDQLPSRITPFDGSSLDQAGPRCRLELQVLDLWGLADHVDPQEVKVAVYWWPEGEALSQAHEIFRGVVRDPEFDLALDGDGAQAGSVSFTIAADTRSPDRPFPPTAIGDQGRFPAAPSSSAQYAVPVIYGTVRGVPLYPISSTSGDPVKLLVAGHQIRSAAVQLGFEGNAGPVAGIKYDIDGRGHLYAYCEVSQAFWAASGDGLYAVSVQGWAAPDGSAIDRLGDVLLHVWNTYGGERFYELDRRRTHGCRDRLNRYRVGLLVNDVQSGGTVLRLLAGRIQPQFPIVFGFAGGRFGWDMTVPVRREGGQPAAHLIYGENCHDRRGPRPTSVDDIVTEFELAYASDGYAGGTVSSARRSAENDGACRAALSRWGASPVQRIEAPDIVDDGTAWTYLSDLVWWRTRRHDRVEYTCDDPDLFDLPNGEEVVVTDAVAGWDRRSFFIEALAPTPDGRVTLVLVGAK